MIELSIQLILFLFPLAFSPGPGNLFFAAYGARFGFASTLSANAGYHVTTWIVTVAIGSGFGLVAKELPNFLVAIKYIGSAYVFYLAWLLFNADKAQGQAEPRKANFVDGAILLIFNPKAYLIIALMFTQFSGASTSLNIWLVFFISTVFTINNFVAFSLWAAFGNVLGAAFRDKTNARRLNMFFGTMLTIVSIWMLTRK